LQHQKELLLSSSQVVHPADPPGQLDVSGEDRDPLGVDGAQVCVGEQHDEERLGSLEEEEEEEEHRA